ncbi:hypothetical protein DMENIID0001_122700 [Sergentomyia squamirostris]
MATVKIDSGPSEQLDKADTPTISAHLEDNINLQDYVVIPSQLSSPGSSSESPENEDLEYYTDAQLKVLLDEAITYKAPKMQDLKDSIEKPEDLATPKDTEEPQLSRKARKKLKKLQSGQAVKEKPAKKEEPVKNSWSTVNNYPETEKYHEWLKKQDLSTLPSYFPRTFTWQEYNTYLKENPEGYEFPGIRLRNLVNKYNIEKNKPPTPPPAPEVESAERKSKREKNAKLHFSHEVVGYRGCDNIATLVEFIENSENQEKVKKPMKGKAAKDSANKKAKKSNPPPQKTKQTPKPKKVAAEEPKNPIEKPAEVPAAPQPPSVKQSQIVEDKVDNVAASGWASGSQSPTNEANEFRLVTKKKKKPKN